MQMKQSIVIAFLALPLDLVLARSVTTGTERKGDEGGLRDLRKRCVLPNFKEVYVFGDSLSDIGNMHSIDRKGAPTGRATDGKVAVETLSQKLGICQSSSLHLVTDHAPGCNWAVRGARSVPLDVPPLLPSSSSSSADDVDVPEHRLPAQISAFLDRHAKNHVPGGEDTLYVLTTGYEDVIDATTAVDRGLTQMWEAKRHLELAASSVAGAVRALIDGGARYVMVVGPPSAADAPRFADTGLKGWKNRARRAGRLTEDLYGYTESAIEQVECDTGVDVVLVDVYGAADDERYSFWNDIYPNEGGHEVLEGIMFQSLEENACKSSTFPEMNMEKCKRNR